ncbi:hypothetical protein [Salicibibacter halophilus]|nr:hypothetical protein [Salicibibacter halophilus]
MIKNKRNPQINWQKNIIKEEARDEGMTITDKDAFQTVGKLSTQHRILKG